MPYWKIAYSIAYNDLNSATVLVVVVRTTLAAERSSLVWLFSMIGISVWSVMMAVVPVLVVITIGLLDWRRCTELQL